MTTEAKIQINSTELGTLWMMYMSTSASLRIHQFLTEKTIDQDAKNIKLSHNNDLENVLNEIAKILNEQGCAIPIAFTEQDIILSASPLYDDIFNVMFLRQMSKLNLGYSSVYSCMSYMKEVNDVYKHNYDISNKYYLMATDYLLGKGVLAQPPYVTIPSVVEFIEDKNYMSGLNPFSNKRSLNTIEVGYINEIILNNIFGMQLLTGFAQVAKESEVREYFTEGIELGEKIVRELSDTLLESNIQPPSTWAGRATDSTQTPFTDKLMIFMTNLIASSSIGYSALGTSFSMRSDLPAKLILISKDTFDYAKKGGKLMIKHRWMEESPQMDDRNQLIKSK